MTGHGELELHAGKGVEITPGIHQITNAEHHALRALSNSGMKDLSVSPFRYWYERINPAPKEEEEETKALRMGSALHCAVLEPNSFDSRYARSLDPSDWPECLETVPQMRDWFLKATGTKASGVLKQAIIDQCLSVSGCPPILAEEERRFLAAHEGKTFLSKKEWERLAGMTAALRQEPALLPVLAEGNAEQTLVAKDPETGVLLKARLDWMAPRFTLDLKTFTVKRGGSIDKAIHDAIYYEGYHRQIVFYEHVRRLVTGEKEGDFASIVPFVESDQPHEVRLKLLTARRGRTVNTFWQIALMEMRVLIRLYADCLDKFGESPWREDRAIETLADEDMRQIAF